MLKHMKIIENIHRKKNIIEDFRCDGCSTNNDDKKTSTVGTSIATLSETFIITFGSGETIKEHGMGYINASRRIKLKRQS